MLKVPNGALVLHKDFNIDDLQILGFVKRKIRLNWYYCFPKYMPLYKVDICSKVFTIKGSIQLLSKKYKELLYYLLINKIVVGCDYDYSKEKK